jgi:hypothetical protein
MSQWPKEAVRHPGKMRYELASAVLDWVADRFFFSATPLVYDPMAGIGTTLAAAIDRGWRARGKEINLHWVQNTRLDLKPHLATGDSILDWGHSAEIHLLSPEFPNTHSQGISEMQVHLRKTKGTYAGNEMSGVESAWHGGRGSWTNELSAVLMPQIHLARSPGLVMVHVKDYVKLGTIVDVGSWVADCFQDLCIELLGHLVVPINYKTHFTGPKEYPLRKIIQVDVGEVIGVKSRREIFEGCVEVVGGVEMQVNHQRFRRPDAPLTKSGHCTKCPKVEGPRVECERVIVGQVRRQAFAK